MVRPDQYICELLFTNDCVIIPGLGGFVSNTRSTFLNPSQHTFTPPSKKVAFNSSLRTNDGLLAHYISQEENITYHEANEIISAYVDDVFRKLALGEQISIDEVGTLSMDLERHLQFDPEPNANFLLSSFGMTSLHSPAIKREEAQMEVVKGDKQPGTTQLKRKKKLWKIIELVPAAAVLAIMIFNPRVVHTLNNNLGNIISVPAPKEINVDDRPETKKDEKTTIEIPAENNNTTAPVVSESTNDSFNQKMIEETAKALQDAFDKEVEEKTKAILAGESVTEVKETKSKVKKEEKVTEPKLKEKNKVAEVKIVKEVKEVKATDKEVKNQKVRLKKYNVIGGVFSVKKNAMNYVKQAQADGYQAAIAGKNKKGRWVVSLVSANSEAELQPLLENIQATYEKNAWVYKK